MSSGPSTRPWETSGCKARLISFPATQTRAWLPFVCTPAWRGAPPRPSRLPAAEVTVSPRRSHSPGSMNPDQAREHRAWRVAACDRKRVVRLATARVLSLPELRVPAQSYLAEAVTNFQSALPIPAQGWPAVAQAFLAPAPPPSPPRPSEGLELPRWAFEPGAHGGRFPNAGGELTRGAFAPGLPRGRERRGRRAPRGWMG